MALDTLAALSPALSQTFAKRFVKAWNRQAIFISQVPVVSDMGQGDAKQVAWDVEFSGATAAAFQEGSDVAPSEFNQDPAVPAVLPWGMYRSAFKLSNLEINAASRSIANATQLGNIVGVRLESSITKTIDVMNTDWFTGTGTDGSGNPNIVGLQAALSATGTYATISKTTYPEWQGNVLANGGINRPLTFDLLANLEQLVFVASGQEPDVLLTSPGVTRKYEGMFESRRMTIDSGNASVPGYQGSTSGGVTGPRTNLYWRNKPVIRDRRCPSGQVFMLTWAELETKYLPFQPLSPDGVNVQNVNAPSSNGTVSQPTNIFCTVYPLARTGSAIPFVAEIYVQAKIARTNAHGWLQDISEV
jgi:cytochrome c556